MISHTSLSSKRKIKEKKKKMLVLKHPITNLSFNKCTAPLHVATVIFGKSILTGKEI